MSHAAMAVISLVVIVLSARVLLDGFRKPPEPMP